MTVFPGHETEAENSLSPCVMVRPSWVIFTKKLQLFLTEKKSGKHLFYYVRNVSRSHVTLKRKNRLFLNLFYWTKSITDWIQIFLNLSGKFIPSGSWTNFSWTKRAQGRVPLFCPGLPWSRPACPARSPTPRGKIIAGFFLTNLVYRCRIFWL